VLDDDRARRANAAGDGKAGRLLALTHFQNGRAGDFGGDVHQRHDDLDLAVDVIGHALRGQNRVLDGRQIAPDPTPAVLRFPNFAHVAPAAGRLPDSLI